MFIWTFPVLSMQRMAMGAGRSRMSCCVSPLRAAPYMLSPCFLGVPSWVWSLFWGIYASCVWGKLPPHKEDVGLPGVSRFLPYVNGAQTAHAASEVTVIVNRPVETLPSVSTELLNSLPAAMYGLVSCCYRVGTNTVQAMHITYTCYYYYYV